MMATLRALAEPHRLHIVELLRDGPRPVGDMVQRLRLRQPQVSKHLRVLSAAGLVDVRVDAPRRMVFDAFTKPELVKQWLLGPPGWTMPVCEIDLRVGGAYRYVWRHADGR